MLSEELSTDRSTDLCLRHLLSETKQLPALMMMIAEEPPEIRDVWYWQCSKLMMEIEVLSDRHRRGLLSGAQEQDFCVLMEQLDEVKTSIFQMGLSVPSLN